MNVRSEEAGKNRRRIAANSPAWFEGPGGELLACTLQNIGNDGAQLCVSPDIAYPSRFTIRLTQDGKVKRLCRLVSHDNGRMDVVFVQADGTPIKTLGLQAPVLCR